MNLASNLVKTTTAHPDRVAVRLGDATTTFGELDHASARVAGVLQDRGVKPGDRVAIMLPNLPVFASIYYGVLRTGGVIVPMNPLLKAREVAYYLDDSGAELIFAWQGVVDEADKGAHAGGAEVIGVEQSTFADILAATSPSPDVADRDDDDTAVILYTSGTTGQPKGAELTHANLMRNVDVLCADLLQLTPDDLIFGGLPLFHSFGQTCTLNAAVRSGACLTLLPRFDPGQALEILSGHRATVFAGVPTMYGALLAQPDKAGYDVSALRVCVFGGAAMPVEVLRGFERTFGCKVLEGYGLSETSPVASFNHPDRERKPGSIGTPIEGVEMKVVDDDGNDVPQGEVGEVVGAAVVLKEGEDLSEDELKSYVKEQVASYKYPRKVWFADELPKGPTGKILKREIEVPEKVAASTSS